MVIAQMATGTAGRQLSTTKQPTQAVFSAAVARLANITHWRPRLPQLQLSGTWKQLVAHLTARWLKAIRLEICTARCVATIGKPHPISGSARMLAAHSAQTQKGIARPSTQPLQNAKTHEEELSWQNAAAVSPKRSAIKQQADLLALHSVSSRTGAQLIGKAGWLHEAKHTRLSIVCRIANAVPCWQSILN